jgi:hypothetical protein
VKRVRLGTFVIGGLLVALFLGLVVSGFASGSPDGLERVAEDKGFIETARDHLFADGPLADYAVAGVGNERLSTGLSGVIGVLVTFALGYGLLWLARGRTRRPDRPRDQTRDRTPDRTG